MKLTDFILFINHSFLSILKKINHDDIVGRSINALVFMIYFILLLFSFIIYGLFLVLKIISYDKTFILVFGISLFFLVRFVVFRRYRHDYYVIIEKQLIKYNFSKNKIIFYFLLFWFIPIFIFWFGMLVIRSLIY